MEKNLLINALIYFGILTIIVALISGLFTGSPYHGAILIRIGFALLFAKYHPIVKDKE